MSELDGYAGYMKRVRYRCFRLFGDRVPHRSHNLKGQEPTFPKTQARGNLLPAD